MEGSETFTAERSKIGFFLVIPRINLVVMRGTGKEDEGGVA
jgi:hypothetical protein